MTAETTGVELKFRLSIINALYLDETACYDETAGEGNVAEDVGFEGKKFSCQSD
jgi:hypothetical protein